MNKPGYVIFNKSDIQWQMVYCNCHELDHEMPEEIVKAITSYNFIGKFYKDDYICMNDGRDAIKNDNNLFVLSDYSGVKYIWQVGSKVADMEGFIIPHAYYVRCIGIVVGEVVKST